MFGYNPRARQTAPEIESMTRPLPTCLSFTVLWCSVLTSEPIASHGVALWPGLRPASALPKDAQFTRYGEILLPAGQADVIFQTHKRELRLVVSEGHDSALTVSISGSDDRRDWRVLRTVHYPSGLATARGAYGRRLSLKLDGTHEYVKLNVNSRARLRFRLAQPLPETTNVVSTVRELGLGANGIFLGYRAGDLSGSPAAEPSRELRAPQGLRAEAVETGSLEANGYLYYVEPYFTSQNAPECRGAAYRAATGRNGAVTLDFGDLRSTVAAQIRALLKYGRPMMGADAADDGGDDDDEEDELVDEEDGRKTAAPSAAGGFRIYRARELERDFRLVQTIDSLDVGTWIDRGTEPGQEPKRRLPHVPNEDIRGNASACWGALAGGGYFYCITAFDKDGEFRASQTVEAHATGEFNQVQLSWMPVTGAAGYKIYRSRNADDFRNSLIGTVEYPQWSWIDTGYAAGSGVQTTVSVRCGKDEAACLAAKWQEIPRERRFLKVGAAEARCCQFRVLGQRHPDTNPREVEFFATQTPPGRELLSPALPTVPVFLHEPFSARAQNIVAEESRLPVGVLPSKQTVNCVYVMTGHGIGHREDFGIQFYNPITGFWEPVHEVRRNHEASNILYVFSPTEVAGVRTFGPFASRGNGFDQAPAFAASFTPVVPLNSSVNGEFVRQVAYPRNRYSYRIKALHGENRLRFDLRNVVSGPAEVRLAVTAERKWREETQTAQPDTKANADPRDEAADPLEVPRPKIEEQPGQGPQKPEFIERTSTIFRHDTTATIAEGETTHVEVPFVIEDLDPPSLYDVALLISDEATGRELLRVNYSLDGFSLLTVTLLKPAYRSSVFADQEDQEVVAGIGLNGDRQLLDKCTLQVQLLKATEQESIREETIEVPKARELTIKYDASQLPASDYRIKATLKGAGGTTLATAEAPFFVWPPSEHVCRLREDGVLLVRGKPCFPIGLYGVPEDDRVMAELSQAGFNSVVWYSPRYYPATSPSRVRTYLDHLHKHGLMGILATPSPDTVNNAAQSQEFIENVVKPLASHPALLSWYLADEPHHSTTDVVGFRQGYEQYCSIDPYHPAALVQQPVSPTAYSWFASGMDVLMIDVYPRFTVDGGPVDHRYPDLIRHCMKAALDAGNRPRPVWYVPPTWNPRRWAPWHEKQYRLPTVQEQRTMAYTAIAHGAKGIIWFSFDGEYVCPKYDCTVPDFWPAFKALASELSYLAPVLLAQDGRREVSVHPPHAPISLLAKEYQGHLYVIAVNRSAHSVPATFTLNEAKAEWSDLTVISEERLLELRQGSFTDALGPYQTHLYTTAPKVPHLPLTDFLADPRLQYQATPEQKANLALYTRGVRWRASSYYPGAGGPLGMQPIDGNPYSWWEGTDGSPWAEIIFPKATQMNRIVVHFLFSRVFDDPNVWKAGARDFTVEHWKEGEWVNLKAIKGNTREKVTIAFPDVITTKLRINLRRSMLSDRPGGRICSVEVFRD